MATSGIGLTVGDAFGAQSMQPPELLIRRGRIVNSDGVVNADVRVVGDTVVEIGPGLKTSAGTQVIEAGGKLVLPGGIDPHTHIKPDYGVDDFTTASMAALAGGITTLGSFAGGEEGQTVQAALQLWSERVQRDAIADVFLHSEGWPPTDSVIAAMPFIAERGQPSFKLFLTENDFGAQIHNVVRLLEAARDAGVVTMFHCEDASIIEAATRRLLADGRTSLSNYPASRPVASEVAATEQVAALCEAIGGPLYVVHLSCARALSACQSTRKLGAPLFVETRPLYLNFTEERMASPDAPLFVGEPPLRSAADSAELWRGLADGRIDVLGSDHAPWTRAQKTDPAVLAVDKDLPGMSDLQFMLPMYFSEGVHQRHLPLTRFVETTSTNAARIFGMYPRKGAIRIGSHADIVIWDPDRENIVTAGADFSNSDYTLYEGRKVKGWPVTTIRRGEIVYDAGRVTGKAGTGRLISCDRWSRTAVAKLQ